MKNVILFGLLFLSQQAFAQLRLPSFISSGMVLQQQKNNRIWGWADANQRVDVVFQGKNYPTFSDQNGVWHVFLNASEAGIAGEMTISAGEENMVLKDILIGEVWVCGGQSNMEWIMGWLSDAYKAELDTAHNDQIRFVTLKKSLATSPQTNVRLDKNWSSIDTASIEECSAVAYFFAKNLNQKLKVPIGLVISSWGGTFSQSWTSFEGLHDFPNYTKTYADLIRPLNLDSIESKNRSIQVRFEQKIKEKAAFVKVATQPNFDDSDWPEMFLPKAWEEQGYPNLDGTVLYRVTFHVNRSDAGKAATLNLPSIDDQDSTFINGQFIGSTYQWDALRTYAIPAGVLKRGKNVLAIYVRDDRSGGGLSPIEEKFNIKIGLKMIPLAGKARFQILTVLEDVTGGNGNIEHQPALLFNAMIAPLIPLSIRGAIWYQGESNAARPWEYRTLFPALITDWRNQWGQGDFPFLFAQISSFGQEYSEPSSKSNWAALREAQTLALALPNTAMAVTIDIGDPKNIHPKFKKEVGDRLADHAMRMVYGRASQFSNGPCFKNYARDADKVLLEFNDIGSGLMLKGESLKAFAIAGDDRKFVWANAEIQGDHVAVFSKKVPNPVAVRYAWANCPIEANLFNKEGYPAIPFQIEINTAKNPVIAHRGAWKKKNLPENSIASLRNAIALGCAGSEFDVRMTADDSLVIHHDPNFNGLPIEKTKFVDLLAFRLSNGEKLPTLREYILAGMQNNPDTKLVCEIKPSEINKARGQEIAQKTLLLFQQLKAQKQTVFISFDYDILKKIIDIEPTTATQYLAGDKSPGQLKIDGISGADFHFSAFQQHPDWIIKAQKNNLVLNVWTVNEGEEIKRLLASGFHFITTNEPELALDLFHR